MELGLGFGGPKLILLSPMGLTPSDLEGAELRRGGMGLGGGQNHLEEKKTWMPAPSRQWAPLPLSAG